MRFRTFGKTGIKVSEISLGTWQLGSKWGDPFNEEVAIKTLDAAIKTDINLFDTADVYQGGMSEKVIGKYIKNLEQKPFVITKIGRRLEKHTKQGYSEKNIRNFIDDSRTNLNVKTLDMVLLHCPPTDVYYMPDVFKLLDQLKLEGKIKHYGVSVERVEEGLKAMDYDGVDAIEIIFNMFRLRPTEYFFNKAQEKKVGVIVRVPLASGLLTGKFHRQSTFEKDDHRAFNRNGEAFDKGETFSGVDYENGLDAVEALKKVFQTQNLTAIALRWILMFDAVSTVIPGASKPEYVYENVNATLLPPLTKEQMKAVEDIYEKYIKDPVHYIW
jgi:aryl-alcohol dehydrogenase-like predicted oxidoreductase